MRYGYLDGTNVRHVLVPSVSVDRLARRDGIDRKEALRIYTDAAIEQSKHKWAELRVSDVKRQAIDALADSLADEPGVGLVLPGEEDLTFLLGGRTYQVSIKQLNR
jgi:hypothetical protein